MRQDDLPLPWNKSFLAIIPGLFASAGWITTDFSGGMLVGLILLVTLLILEYWLNNRKLPGWGLMAVGMLAAICLVVASGVFGGLLAITAGPSANTMVLLVLLITLIILMRFLWRDQGIPGLVWIIIPLIILCQLAVRAKYFVLFGLSWSVAGQWLNISLYAAGMTLLLPVVLGGFVAKRYGLQTILFVIGMIYVSFQILIDVNYKVSDQLGATLGFLAYKILIPFIFTVLAPLWFLRARSSLKRAAGMVALIGLAVMVDLLVVGSSYAGELPLIIWISFIPFTISVLLAVVLAYLLYQESEKRITQPHSDHAAG